jgi:DNA-directed RNA polymerase subunit RPC12/RpoP
MMRFSCPTCQKVLKAPADEAGRKIHCPRCGQRLEIPPPPQPVNHTVLAHPVLGPHATSPRPAAPGKAPLVTTCPKCGKQLKAPDDLAGKQVRCPGCGSMFVANPDAVRGQGQEEGPAPLPLTCQDCGKGFGIHPDLVGSGLPITCPHCRQPYTGRPQQSTAAIAPAPGVRRRPPDEAGLEPGDGRRDDYEDDRPRKRREDDDYYDDRPRRRRDDDEYEDDRPRRRRGEDDDDDRRRRPSFRCPYCGSDAPPSRRSQVSTVGWVLFIILLLGLCTAPFCWIGLLIREDYRVCGDCGTRLG